MNEKANSPRLLDAFKRDASAKWSMLNPRYIQSDDSFGKMLAHAAQETLPEFFAPLRFAGWLLRYGFSAAYQTEKE